MRAIPDVPKEIQRSLDRAKIALMQRPDSAFFTTLCFSLKVVWTGDTARIATDGKHLFVNPASWMALTPGQRVSRLMHATLRPALLHLDRMGTKDPNKWACAGEHHVNLLLLDQGYERLAHWHVNAAFETLSTDAIYKLLPEGSQPTECELVRPNTDKEQDALNAAVDDTIIRAHMAHELSGGNPNAIPGGMLLMLQRLIKPKLPWNQILDKWINGFYRGKYSLKKPNRRFLPEFYLPTLSGGDNLMAIDFAVDASFSVKDHEFSFFITEMEKAFRRYKPKRTRLVTFDVGIRQVDTITKADALKKIEFHGRGGTAIGPVLQWANANKSKALIVFSDGDFHWPDVVPKMPVVWLIHNNPKFTAPYGQVIHYEV